MTHNKKYNFTLFQDLLREKRDGKYSSKKIWGAIIMLLVCLAFIADGLHFYTVNEHLFDSMLLSGTTLIGIGALSMLRKKDNKTTDEEQN